jgi:hypothetical protein
VHSNRYREIFFEFLTVNSGYFPTQRLPIRHFYGNGMCLLKEGNEKLFFFSSTFKAQWSLYVPPVLTFNNSMFCPHSVFMCFVWM